MIGSIADRRFRYRRIALFRFPERWTFLSGRLAADPLYPLSQKTSLIAKPISVSACLIAAASVCPSYGFPWSASIPTTQFPFVVDTTAVSYTHLRAHETRHD